MNFLMPALAFVSCVLIVILDNKKVIRLTGKAVSAVLLIVAPHIVLLSYLCFTSIPKENFYAMLWAYIPLVILLLYWFVKLNVVPWFNKKTDNKAMNILYGGARICDFGIYATAVQILLCTALCFTADMLNIPTGILVADIIVTALTVYILFINSALRMILTSKRLRVASRAIMVFVLFIPLVHIFVINKACYKAKDEYNYFCEKAEKKIQRAGSMMCQTKYPIVLVHGVGFRDREYFNYWGRIPTELEALGAVIYYGNQEAWGTIEHNAEQIKNIVLQAMQENNTDKVNIIAHSKGGLDARYMISCLDMANSVASLTTMSTPHRGCKYVDYAMKMPEKQYKMISEKANSVFTFLGDTNADFYSTAKCFTTEYMEQFNKEVPDCESVYYQSYASVMKNFMSDRLLSLPYILGKTSQREEENDGLVTISSAKWGNFKGVFRSKGNRGISHGDMIDLKREDYFGFDVIEEYIKIVNELKTKGY